MLEDLAYKNNTSKKYFNPFINKETNDYYYVYYYDFDREKREKKSTRTKDHKLATRFFNKFKSTILFNRTPTDVKTISDLRDIIFKYQENRYSENNLKLYKMSLDDLSEIIGNKPLGLVTFFDIEQFKAERLKVPVKPTTVNIELRTLKAAFNYAVNLGVISENLVKRVRQLVVPEEGILYFNDEELKRLLDTIDRDFFRNLVLFGLYTACRRSEIVNIQWKDIDLENEQLHIRNKENFKTKTRRERSIPISNDLLNLLIKIESSGSHSKVFQIHKPDDYVFPKENGSKYTSSHISRLFKRYVRKAGLNERFHFHVIRHSALSRLAANGVPLYQIQEIAGHASSKTTELYLHVTSQELKSAINKLKYNIL